MKLRTYLVEDNPTIRENLIATLEELADVEAVGIAETESAGTDWLQQNPDAWDLAIVDLFLRQGSGLGVLTACRERQPHQKIVVLSNYATPDIRSRCAQLGVDAVFDKSNEIDALMDYCMNIDAASLNQLKTALTQSTAFDFSPKKKAARLDNRAARIFY